MSTLLDDLIQQSRAETVAYEAFLSRAEDLVKRLTKQNHGDHPVALHGHPLAIVLFNNLRGLASSTFHCPEDITERAELALKLDLAVREKFPAAWKGDETRERQARNVLFDLVGRDREATRALFDIIKNQSSHR